MALDWALYRNITPRVWQLGYVIYINKNKKRKKIEKKFKSGKYKN
jgi:hypothetical protein